MVLEDPEVSDYIQEIGHSLSSHAEEGQHQFNYFVVRDPAINAFAMPGGFIAINSGLILADAQRKRARRRHGARDRARHPAASGPRHDRPDACRPRIDGGDAGRHPARARPPAAAIPAPWRAPSSATQSAAIQHQINYTRSPGIRGRPDRHRHHGERRLRSARHGELFRGSGAQWRPSPSRIKAIEFLIDHPLSADRVAEARNRAAADRPHSPRRIRSATC